MAKGKTVKKGVKITLPDGSVKAFDGPVSGEEVAAAIGPGLAKAALAMRVDGALLDIYALIEKDAKVSIITEKGDDGLELLRHDCAHIMAEAVKELWPETQITIGPIIEDGFYYDFSRKEPFTLEDLPKIEERMREIVKRDEIIRREVWDRKKAIKFFKDLGEIYKAEIIADLPQDEEISLYRQGNFIDLCRGPHLPSTAKLGSAFKLMKVAGAYWRGDSNNEMLTRIYGTCWRDKKELSEYLHRLEEAEKRDHRKIATKMDLFHFQDEAPGMAFWHEQGWTIWRTLETYLRKQLEDGGYQEIRTPLILDRSLWEKSGHWEKFRKHMYTSEAEDRVVAIKPMNCPGHVQVYNKALHSYRDLPLRLSEFGSCHRFEPSGALHGLMRVRAFTQDDAHIFCTEEQVTAETIKFCDLLHKVYKDLGFEDVVIKYSNRPDVRAGEDRVWDKAEKALLEALESTKLEYSESPGEGAFYGPKLDFVLRDAIGRDWQCGTWQVDFVLPDRLDATYIGEDGNKHQVAMLHRAIFGSFERFIGILIEHYAGRFPLWLAPTQVVIATITSDGDDFAKKAYAALRAAGLRPKIDLRNEKINYKVREHSHALAPVMFVIGKREAQQGTVSIRRLGPDKQESKTLEDAIKALAAEAAIPE